MSDLANQSGFERAEIRLMKIMGVILIKNQSSKDEISIKWAIPKLPTIVSEDASAVYYFSERETDSDYTIAFPEVYIN